MLGTLLSLSLPFVLVGCGSGTDGRNPEIPGIQGPTVNLIEDNIVIGIVFETVELDAGVRVPIPEYEHSFIELSPHLQSGGTVLSAIISLQDVFDDELAAQDPERLPGGRPLPGVPSGELPAVAFTVKSFSDMSFYVGNNVYGVFFPVDLGIDQIIATYRFYIEGRRSGNISVVGNDENDEFGGVLLMLDLNAATVRQLKKIAKKYAD